MCLTLAKAGYFAGNPCEVAKASADWIIKSLDYEMFCRGFEEQLHLINKNENR